jgi:hypothetical protein
MARHPLARAGDVVNIVGYDFHANGPQRAPLIVDALRHSIVLHPDTFISTTKIADAFPWCVWCLRSFLLAETATPSERKAVLAEVIDTGHESSLSALKAILPSRAGRLQTNADRAAGNDGSRALPMVAAHA